MAGPSVMVRVLGDMSKLGSAFDQVASAGKSSAGSVKSAFDPLFAALNRTGVLSPLTEAFTGMGAAIEEVKNHIHDLPLALVAVGGTLATLGTSLEMLGSKDKAAHQQLQAAVQATGKAYDGYDQDVEKAIKTQERYGTTANKTQDALRVLTQATNDPKQALNELGVAADLAAAKHEDLTTAATQLAKAGAGSSKVLKEFGISNKDAAGHVKTNAEIVGELSQKLSGQASAATNTLTGHMKALTATVEDAVSSFGSKFGPAIRDVGVGLSTIGGAIKGGQAAIGLFKSGLDAAQNSEKLMAAASKIAAAAQWLFNIAMDANPIVLVILAVIALVAVLVYLATHVKAVRQAFEDVWHWIAANWPLLLGIILGPVALAIVLIIRYWSLISQAAGAALAWIEGIWSSIVGFFAGIGSAIWSTISGAFRVVMSIAGAALGYVLGAWSSLVGFFAGIAGAVAGVLSGAFSAIIGVASSAVGAVRGVFSGLVGFFSGLVGSIAGVMAGVEHAIVAPFQAAVGGVESAVNAIVGAAEKIGSAISKIPGVGAISSLLHLQTGGIVTRPTVALIGEAGPEMVIPLRGPHAPQPLPTTTFGTAAGPAVVIQTANFSTELDVDAFMRRAAWVASTQMARGAA